MKTSAVLFLALAVLSPRAEAFTQIFFNKGIPQVNVIMQSIASDDDATALFDALNVEQHEGSGRLEKKLPLSGATVEFICTVTTIGDNRGTCSIVFEKGENTQMNFSRRTVDYAVTGNDGIQIAQWFNHPAQSGMIYRSKDKRVWIEYVAPVREDAMDTKIAIRVREIPLGRESLGSESLGRR